MTNIQKQLNELKKQSDEIDANISYVSLYLNEQLNSFLLMFGHDCINRGINLMVIFEDAFSHWIVQIREIIEQIENKLNEK